MNQKRGLRLFLTACVPGCGQMYQGYMKRGLSLMLGCCTLFAVSMTLRLDVLTIFLVPAWLYAFFDTYNLRTLQEQGLAPQDDWLFGMSDVDQEKLRSLCRGRHSLVGWGLVFLGLYTLFDGVVKRLLHDFLYDTEFFWIYGSIVNFLPRFILTIGIIALGIWFIRGPKPPKGEDIPAFTPLDAPACEEAPEEEDRHEST